MDLASFKNTIEHERNFTLRRAIERLREGIFDPLAVRLLTAREDKLVRAFDQGLSSPRDNFSPHLCVAGDYGQGKSHSLAYLQEKALKDGFATSMINLDPREVPFHDFRQVYRELLARIRFPDHEGTFFSRWKSWSEDFASRAKNNGNRIQATLPDEMPHFFKAMLTAAANKTIPLSDKKKTLKKHRQYHPREFPFLLKRALSGTVVPVYRLRNVCRYRSVDFYKDAPLKCTNPHDYLTQIFCMAALFKQMGYKGWVVLFDEGESIAQMRITGRSKSYRYLHRFFLNSPAVTELYPVFAFTDDFFFRLKEEDYDRIRVTKKGELPYFDMNYAHAWKNLDVHRLHDLSGKEWDELTRKLLLLHTKAYKWTPENGRIQEEMETVLAQTVNRETRLRMQSLVNQLDIAHQEGIQEDRGRSFIY
ncbi:MAG: DUF2791 family P-loop domain-containing protein [Deltaproteobacteria bacterium]|nr:DUF2791 family P-loop domain-containing protein [Deltaproteobacteria bacterium]